MLKWRRTGRCRQTFALGFPDLRNQFTKKTVLQCHSIRPNDCFICSCMLWRYCTWFTVVDDQYFEYCACNCDTQRCRIERTWNQSCENIPKWLPPCSITRFRIFDCNTVGSRYRNIGVFSWWNCGCGYVITCCRNIRLHCMHWNYCSRVFGKWVQMDEVFLLSLRCMHYQFAFIY